MREFIDIVSETEQLEEHYDFTKLTVSKDDAQMLLGLLKGAYGSADPVQKRSIIRMQQELVKFVHGGE